ncbi:MAG: glycosyltransferase [Actinobacteria bacterium]|nr:MAG: glycosyltransferase [Actinomycetota bacterium]
MAPTVSIAVPTRERPEYLAVALESIAPQAASAGADVLVIDDGALAENERLAARFGARYVAHPEPRGLNAARNTALRHTSGELVAFVDDDVRVLPGWLQALARGAQTDADVLTGPIIARFEDHAFRMCGREGPPITAQDYGPQDRDVERAWGANMAVRRSAVARIGEFDESRELYGDEQEWQHRLRAAGGRLLYVAAATLEHRRAGDDARLRALARAAFARGQASRRFDAFLGRAPSLMRELRVLAGCLVHAPRFRCANGLVMAGHSLGRLSAVAGSRSVGPAAPPGQSPDFLSGRSGTVGGRRGQLRALGDAALDLLAVASAQRRRLRAAGRVSPGEPLRVLALAVVRPEHAASMAAIGAELERSRHRVELATGPPGELGKFQNLNALLAAHPPAGRDWLIVVDDDIELPAGFLDGFLFLCERFSLRLAQPAHRLVSHAAWPVTRRRALSVARETPFVEIGPCTAFRRDTFEALLPFPDLRMGWGLDAHWAAVARERGWRVGVIDALPIAHRSRPAGAAYSREAAVREAREFLASRAYVPREEANRTLATHRRVPSPV